MNRHFLNSFKELRGSEEYSIFHTIRKGEAIPVMVQEEQKDYIRKYLLKSEYIASVEENQITVSTNNSEYIIEFYESFITIFERLNCHTMLKTKSDKRYIKYIK